MHMQMYIKKLGSIHLNLDLVSSSYELSQSIDIEPQEGHIHPPANHVDY